MGILLFTNMEMLQQFGLDSKHNANVNATNIIEYSYTPLTQNIGFFKHISYILGRIYDLFILFGNSNSLMFLIR